MICEPGPLEDEITQAAGEPASATSDGQSATAHRLSELIAADRYLRGTKAACGTKTGWGLTRMARFRPPGAGPD